MSILTRCRSGGWKILGPYWADCILSSTVYHKSRLGSPYSSINRNSQMSLNLTPTKVMGRIHLPRSPRAHLWSSCWRLQATFVIARKSSFGTKRNRSRKRTSYLQSLPQHVSALRGGVSHSRIREEGIHGPLIGSAYGPSPSVNGSVCSNPKKAGMEASGLTMWAL